MRIGRTLLLTGFLALAGFGTKLAIECNRHTRNIQPSLLPTSLDESSVRPKVLPPDSFTPSARQKEGRIEAKKFPASAPTNPVVSREAAHFQLLAELADKNTINLESVELEAVPLEEDEVGGSGSSRCIGIKVNGEHLGYARSWFPANLIQRVQSGEELGSLFEVFPMPIDNVYYDIFDLDGNSVGKQGTFYSRSAKTYLHSFIWNQGVEELYVFKKGGYYLVDNQGAQVIEKPVWTTTVLLDHSSNNRYEGIRLVKDPSVRLIVSSHHDGDIFNYRLQDSCEEEANMRSTFLQIHHADFHSFIVNNFETVQAEEKE